jgi:D-amino-acid dehydrogenase
VAGRLEIVGHDMKVDSARIRALAGEAHDLFPALQAETPMHTGWAGARPATPSGLPFIGKSPLANLYLNTGHGALGWTLACGSAALLASLICGEHPYIDAAPFAYNEPH